MADWPSASATVVRTTAAFTVTVASGAEASYDATLVPGIQLIRIQADKACRVRAYASAAQRTADASRAPGTDPDSSTDHGVLLDFVLPSTDLDWTLTPAADIHTGDGTGTLPLLVKNNGGSANVTITLTYVRTE